VTASTYADVEADGFTGLGLGEPGSREHLEQVDLDALLAGYDSDLGTQARRLVVRHHAAQHHAAALVALYGRVAGPSPAAAGQAGNVLQLTQDRFALEHRAVAAEWEVLRREREIIELRGEIESRLREREHLLARIEGLGDRLRRARTRAQRLRRQRDRARGDLTLRPPE
jgi:hypothetical protein